MFFSLAGQHQNSIKSRRKFSSAGLSAEVAEVDALDEQSVNHHLEKTFEKTERIDISFNAIEIQ